MLLGSGTWYLARATQSNSIRGLACERFCSDLTEMYRRYPRDETLRVGRTQRFPRSVGAQEVYRTASPREPLSNVE